MGKNKRLYNYLVNTFGISKEVVLGYVETRLEDLISRHVQNLLLSNRIEKLIMDRVTHFIKNGEVGYYREKNAFNNVVKEQVRQVVEDQLRTNCEVKFEFTPNSVQYMKEL